MKKLSPCGSPCSLPLGSDLYRIKGWCKIVKETVDAAYALIYLCLLLLGLSGIVRFSLPLSSRGKRILRLK